MEKPPLMKCGHTANATDSKGNPCCVICSGIDVGAVIVENSPPDISGRTAKCLQCKKEVPSDFSLPFFELGAWLETSPRFEDYKCAGDKLVRLREELPKADERIIQAQTKVHELLRECRQTATVDGWYCGCRGWD